MSLEVLGDLTREQLLFLTDGCSESQLYGVGALWQPQSQDAGDVPCPVSQ